MTIWASLPALVVPEVLAVVGDVAGVALGLVILIAGGTWELAEEVDRNICSDRIKGPSFGGERVELEGRSDDILSWVLERLQHELHGTRVASLVSAAVVNDELFLGEDRLAVDNLRVSSLDAVALDVGGSKDNLLRQSELNLHVLVVVDGTHFKGVIDSFPLSEVSRHETVLVLKQSARLSVLNENVGFCDFNNVEFICEHLVDQ